jgi:hypothetical protein
MDLNARNWSEITRLLIALGGLVVMVTGVGVAGYIRTRCSLAKKIDGNGWVYM